MQRDIIHEWFYRHSPEKVWNFLTQPGLLATWLMENDIRPEVGHQFRFKTKSRPGFDGNIFCEVLEVVPQQRLTYTWRGGPSPGKITLDTVVTWTLTAKDGGTLLRLEHKGFRGMKNFIAYLVMNKGWQLIGKRFLQHLDTQR